MIVPAFLFDADSGATIARFGLDVESAPGTEPPYLPHRWGLARRYTVPARGPGDHPWRHWMGALLILTTVFALLGRAL